MTTHEPKDPRPGGGSGRGAVLGVLLGLVASVATTFTTSYLGWNSEESKQLLEAQIAAYIDFSRAQAAHVRAEQLEAADPRTRALGEAGDRIRDAAFRMAVVSDERVVASVAEYIRKLPDREGGARPACAAGAGLDVGMYQRMRDDLLGGALKKVTGLDAGNVGAADMAMILFGCTLPAAPVAPAAGPRAP